MLDREIRCVLVCASWLERSAAFYLEAGNSARLSALAHAGTKGKCGERQKRQRKQCLQGVLEETHAHASTLLPFVPTLLHTFLTSKRFLSLCASHF